MGDVVNLNEWLAIRSRRDFRWSGANYWAYLSGDTVDTKRYDGLNKQAWAILCRIGNENTVDTTTHVGETFTSPPGPYRIFHIPRGDTRYDFGE